MESHARSIIKSMTYRTLGLGVTMAVAYLITRQWALAASIGAADTIAKLGTYYAHERAWSKIKFGRRLGADYEI